MRNLPRISTIGGSAFLFGGISALPEPVQAPLRMAAVGLIAFALVAILFRRRVMPSMEPPTPGAMRVYWVAVVLLLLLMPVTRIVAEALHTPTAQIALVAAVVGAHFLPFARAFRAPVFSWIGGSMLVLGLGGALLAALGSSFAGPAGAAAAGAEMLVIVAAQAFLGAAPSAAREADRLTAPARVRCMDRRGWVSARQ